MTLVVSALLVIAGFVALGQARDLRIVPDQPPTRSVPATPTSRVPSAPSASASPYIGVRHATGGSYGTYWTQTFGG